MRTGDMSGRAATGPAGIEADLAPAVPQVPLAWPAAGLLIVTLSLSLWAGIGLIGSWLLR